MAVNPNSKIPAGTDKTAKGEIVNLFESGSMLMYLAEKYSKFLPSDPKLKAEIQNWINWQMGGQG